MKLLLVLLLVLVPFSQASAMPINVNASPLWTDTGISLLATQTVSFTAFAPIGGGWTYQPLPLFGPEGVSVPCCAFDFDEWITNQQHGQLIGFIGNVALDSILQNDSRLFAIGAGPQSRSGTAGKLWLGINDGYVTGTNDNGGFVTVNVNVASPDLTPVPEPATLLLFGTTAGGLALARWRRSRQQRQA
jgi:hypothetical protein